MFCHYCGREISEKVAFCPYCGKKVAKIDINDKNGAETGILKKRRKWRWILTICMAVAVTIAALCCLLQNKEGIKEGEQEFQAYYEPITENDIAIEDGIYYVDSRILITAVDSSTYAEVEAMMKEYEGKIIGYISTTDDYQIFFPAGKTYQELDSIVQELRDNAMIEEAAVSYAAKLGNDSVIYTKDPWADADEPSDSSGLIWDEKQPEGKNWWAEAIGMPSVWEMDIEYQSVKVGIIDSMFDLSNEDLDQDLFAKVWNNPEDDAGNCNVSNLYQDAVQELSLARQSGDQDHVDAAKSRVRNTSHGTHVSGIIAAEANNDHGIAGVSQNTELYGYAVLSEDATSSSDSRWGDIFMFKVAIANLLNEGVKVINISMGFNEALKGTQDGDSNWSTFTSVNSDALESFLFKYIQSGDEFLIIKSAGNDSNENLKYDAGNDIFGSITNEVVADRIIVVGAAELKSGYYSIADFSNTGNRVDVFAPGVDVLSDIPTNVTILKSGTSMATPIVSGLAALIWGINPDLSAEQVRQIIITSTSASAFLLDHRSSFARDWINFFEDPTAIVNAKICVDLAQSTANEKCEKESEYGTIIGIIYALSSNGQYVEEFEIESLTAYDENGNDVSDISIQDIAIYYTDDSGTDALFKSYSYTVLLAPGNYTIEVNTEEYGAKSCEITIAEGDVNVVEFEFEASDSSKKSRKPSETPDYSPVLEQYQDALSHHCYLEEDGTIDYDAAGEYVGLEILAAARYYKNYGDEWSDENFYMYYALSDLNEDGRDELFIGGGTEDGVEIYEAFTHDGEKPVPLFKVGGFGYRYHLAILKDNTLATEGSGGAELNDLTFYRLQENSLVPESIEEYSQDGDEYSYRDGDGHEYSIVEDDYYTAFNRFYADEKELSWMLIEADSLEKPTEDSLREVLYRELGDANITDFCAADYDRDGDLEAFAVIGEFDEDEWSCYGSLYFVTAGGVEQVLGEEAFYVYDEKAHILEFDECSFYLIEKYAATGGATYVFSVSDNDWYESEISLAGMGLTQISGTNKLEITESAYDGAWDKSTDLPSGHTWKPYYLYWDHDCFREYGGIQISRSDFCKCDGAEAVLKQIEQNGYTISDIIYRANGIININYCYDDEYFVSFHNCTLLLEGTRVTIQHMHDYGDGLLHQSDFEGIYAEAFLPDIAVYPETFPLSDGPAKETRGDMTEEEAVAIAYEYWEIDPGAVDESSGYEMWVFTEEFPTETNHRYHMALRWLVEGHWSTLDEIYIDSETGACTSCY